MSTIQQLLEEKTAAALTAVSGLSAPALVNPAANPKFGDYQANGVMAVAKTQKKNPRQLAQEVSARLNPDEIPASWEIRRTRLHQFSPRSRLARPDRP